MRRISRLLAAVALAATALMPATKADAEPKPSECAGVVRTASPIGTTACPGVRPGGLVEVPSTENACTLSFLYTGTNSKTYVTTAGHCAMAADATGAKVWRSGKGPVAVVAGKKIGRFVFARVDPDGQTEIGKHDIGVIELAKGVKANPQVCHFGGPTGVNTTKTGPARLELYGNADGLSFVAPARSLVALGMPDDVHITALGPGFVGDSGGPVLNATTGGAVGFVFGLGYGHDLRSPTNPSAGFVLIKRITPQIITAQQALKTVLRLRTAPRL